MPMDEKGFSAGQTRSDAAGQGGTGVDSLVTLIEARLDRRGFQDAHWTGTFWEYLKICQENPAVLRNAYQRMYDATQMGGMQVLHVTSLGTLLLHERTGPVAPYDGEVWSWSPPELNRIAYVNKDGDLWIAHADGRDPRRVLRGNFTLPAWSGDGQMIAVAERKNGGRKWEISVVAVPRQFLR